MNQTEISFERWSHYNPTLIPQESHNGPAVPSDVQRCLCISSCYDWCILSDLLLLFGGGVFEYRGRDHLEVVSYLYITNFLRVIST